MQKPSWKIRRRIVNVTLLFCASTIVWILWNADQGELYKLVVMCCFGLAAGVIGSYVFGAAWDDKNYMNMIKPISRRPPPVEDDGFPEGM